MLGSLREKNIADVWYRIYMYYTVTVYEKVWLTKKSPRQLEIKNTNTQQNGLANM